MRLKAMIAIGLATCAVTLAAAAPASALTYTFVGDQNVGTYPLPVPPLTVTCTLTINDSNTGNPGGPPYSENISYNSSFSCSKSLAFMQIQSELSPIDISGSTDYAAQASCGSCSGPIASGNDVNKPTDAYDHVTQLDVTLPELAGQTAAWVAYPPECVSSVESLHCTIDYPINAL